MRPEQHPATPTLANLRVPLWQGRQPVAALWFSSAWLEPAQREARLLQAWRTGSHAWRFADGDLLCLPEPIWMECAQAVGLPLRRVDGVLQAGPLTAEERAQVPAADLILVEAAQAQPRRLAEGESLDVSLLLDVSQHTLRTTYDLSIPEPPPLLPELQGKDVRQLLGKAIPPRSEASEQFLRSLHGQPSATQGAPLQRVSRWWRDVAPGIGLSVLSWVGNTLDPGRTGGSTGSVGGIAPRRNPRPVRPSAWRMALGRLAMLTRASRVFGYRQGAHLRRMMGMFERGDLHEALRHALPLGGEAGSRGPAFGTPGRRESLTLSGARGAGTTIALDEALMDHLRTMYRAAFERLDRAGRIDEAVFVLAELLHARQEALDYLVKHARLAQAAELALGWDMPPAMVIRLLMLAGDTARAVLVARRDNAFADAIALLQADHPEQAEALRTLWAVLRADHGDWLGAVETIWPLPSQRGQALAWLLAAEAAGTVLSVRALVQRATLLPETLADHAARIDALLEVEGDAQLRLGMADALLDIGAHNASTRALAAHLLPVLASDRSRGRSHWPQERFQRLLKLSANAVLRADMPSWATTADAPVPAPLGRSPLLLTAPSPGLHSLHDLAGLPGGRYLVALGEAGAVVIDAQGRVQQRFAVPAFRLVIGDSGEAALAVATREQISRVERLDLATRRVTALGTIASATFASTFDTTGWTVLIDNRIRTVDASRHVNDVLWHVDLPGPVVAADFFGASEVYLVAAGHELEVWRYRLPGRRRGAHEALQPVPDLPLLPTPETGALQPRIYRGSDGRLQLEYAHNGLRTCALLAASAAETLTGDSHFQALDCGLLVHLPGTERSHSVLLRYRDAAVLARVEWPGPAQVRAREQAGLLLLHDRLGRWVHIDTDTGATHSMQLLHV
ncbi:bpX6 domain-containing protein [Stenotrophomonas sp.]|uniref:bpX6 domain-containing protein n=1 Tax=Stenotrophomonas sp. TaxID=69392 RepID=UPI0028971237|nr:bpX6 domain-containing protein [Stenotrophomonas sp.]